MIYKVKLEGFLRDGKYALLTPSFISDNHQLSLPSQFCQALVDRILQASNYAHQPPAFAYKVKMIATSMLQFFIK